MDALRADSPSGAFDLHYQPIVETQSRHVVAFEALLRPRHGTGWTSPESVITAAEQSGTMPELGRRVIERAMLEIGYLRSAGPGADVAISINVSPSELDGEAYVTSIEESAQRHGVPLDKVWIEVTETVPMHDLVAVAETLEGLRELGVTTCIDDFGAGWTTIDQIRALPLDIVKIDRLVTQSDPADPADWSTRGLSCFEFVAGVLNTMGVRTLAEGVENEELHQRVLLGGCTYAQGWLYGRPLPAAIAFADAMAAAQGGI